MVVSAVAALGQRVSGAEASPCRHCDLSRVCAHKSPLRME